VSDRLKLDLTLVVGTTQQTIEVTGQEPALQTQTSHLDTLIDQEAVQDLPVNNRNSYLDATCGRRKQLRTGSREETDRTTAAHLDGSVMAISVGEHFEIDGITHGTVRGHTIVKPSMEAIQEMQVQTNLYTAEVENGRGRD